MLSSPSQSRVRSVARARGSLTPNWQLDLHIHDLVLSSPQSTTATTPHLLLTLCTYPPIRISSRQVTPTLITFRSRKSCLLRLTKQSLLAMLRDEPLRFKLVLGAAGSGDDDVIHGQIYLGISEDMFGVLKGYEVTFGRVGVLGVDVRVGRAKQKIVQMSQEQRDDADVAAMTGAGGEEGEEGKSFGVIDVGKSLEMTCEDLLGQLQEMQGLLRVKNRDRDQQRRERRRERGGQGGGVRRQSGGGGRQEEREEEEGEVDSVTGSGSGRPSVEDDEDEDDVSEFFVGRVDQIERETETLRREFDDLLHKKKLAAHAGWKLLADSFARKGRWETSAGFAAKTIRTPSRLAAPVRYPHFLKGYVYAPSKIPQWDNHDPPFDLELEFIYGSSRKGCKGDILHTNEAGQLVYPAAACGVVYDPLTHSQRCVFRKHVDDVKCLTVHPSGRIAATGECGLDDMIYVWTCNEDECEVLSAISSHKWFTQGGVLGLAFAGEDFICAVGGHPEQTTLLVFNWRTGRLLAQRPCARRAMIGIASNPHTVTEDSMDLVWYGVDTVKFFHYENGYITVSRGIVSLSGGKMQSMYCCIFDNNKSRPHAYLGTKDGSVYVFAGSKLVTKRKLHRGALYTLEKLPNGFATGGKDGIVKICQFAARSGAFDVVKEFNIGTACGSLGLSPDARTIYTFGKFDSRLCSVDIETGECQTLAVSHSGLSIRNELWGLATVPNEDRFMSAGDDGKMILWDYETHQHVRVGKKKGHHFRSIAVHPSGAQFASATKKGIVAVFNMEEFIASVGPSPAHIAAIQCGTQEIAALRFAPTGDYLAAGSHDGCIYVLSTRTYRKIGVLRGHTSYITGIDWSLDGQYLQSTSGDYELLFWDIRMKGRTRGSDMADTEFATHTCILGWKVRGIWEGGELGQSDGTDINGCTRHGDKLVSVDDFGRVNTYRFPTLMEDAPEDRYIGHCSHVTAARFSHDGDYVFTAGGGDLTIFQWRIVPKGAKFGRTKKAVANASSARFNTTAPPRARSGNRSSMNPLRSSFDPSSSLPSRQQAGQERLFTRTSGNANALSKSVTFQRRLPPKRVRPARPVQTEEMVDAVGMFKPVKYPRFLKGYVHPPSRVPHQPNLEPGFLLDLEFIYGSSRKGCKGDILHTNASGLLVYPAAACGVIFDPRTQTQRCVFRQHVDDVKCLTVHPSGKFAATGECGLDDMIYVWTCDEDECRVLSAIKSHVWFTQGGVLGLAFAGNDFLCAVGGNPEQTSLLVFHWRSGKLLAQRACARRAMFGVASNPHTVTEDSMDLVWYGKDTVKFFHYESGVIKVARGIVALSGGKMQSMYCCIFDNNADRPHAYLGTKDGSVYVFAGSKLVTKRKLHRGPLFTLEKLPNGFATGGKDGIVMICEFAAEAGAFTVLKELQLRSACGSLGLSLDARTVYTFGKFDSRLCAINIDTEECQTLAVSHSGLSIRNELWGLSSVPNETRFMSAGDDGKIILWDYVAHQCIRLAKKRGHQFRSIDVHPSGGYFACGTKKGVVAVFLMEDFVASSGTPPHQAAVRCGNQEIAALRFSPTGEYLAAGSHDSSIHVLSTKSYRTVAVLGGHTSYITGMDWSCDGHYLQSTSGDYELLFWDVRLRGRTRAADMADTEWASQTCILGWKVRGIWEGGALGQSDGTDINGCTRHGDKLVSVDDFGRVNTYRFPTLVDDAPEDRYIGHCSHVTSTRFSHDGQYVFTAGGGDLTIFQWRVVPKSSDHALPGGSARKSTVDF